jgi:N-acylneuraminate cytidylyltransferase
MQGRPLIAYTIEAARGSGLFNRIVVSTDDAEIARVSTANGAEVPFLREAALSDDVTPVSAATVDALERLDPNGRDFALVCQLMPNCPLRTAADIQASYRQYVETGAEAQVSVVRYGWQNPWWAMRRAQDLTLEPLFEERMAQRSQDLPELFCPTGAVWWAKADVVGRYGTFHVPGRKGWEISWEHGIDIDSEDDWILAETLMRHGAHGDRNQIPPSRVP